MTECNTIRYKLKHTYQGSFNPRDVRTSFPYPSQKIVCLVSDEAIPNFADRSTRSPTNFRGESGRSTFVTPLSLPSPALATIRKIRAPDLVCPPWYCVHKKLFLVLERFVVTFLFFTFYNCLSSASCIKICYNFARRQ
jgi:hypothetical protein